MQVRSPMQKEIDDKLANLILAVEVASRSFVNADVAEGNLSQLVTTE